MCAVGEGGCTEAVETGSTYAARLHKKTNLQHVLTTRAARLSVMCTLE